MKELIQEFKEFAVKGNAVDLAVGLVIGTAFGKIVTSLVNDIIMPPFGLLLGNIDFSKQAVVLQHATGTKPEILLSYGNFVSTVINFLIIALSIFFVIRMMRRWTKQEKAKEDINQSEETKTTAAEAK